jgi:Fe-S-cluster containining protein
VSADLNDPVATELEQQLRHSSFFMQASLEQQGKLTAKLDVYVTALIDLLFEQGVVDAERLSDAIAVNRQRQAEDTAARHSSESGLPPWPTVLVRDEDSAPPAEATVIVDCEARLPICKAVCCTLPFPLSAAEVEGGKVKWDLGHPYMIRHDQHGMCVHNDHSTGGCTIYADRPAVCHGYSCANDERIWKDFDAMVLNEEFLGSRKRNDFRFTPVSGNAVPVTVRTGRRREAAEPVAGGATPAAR